MSKIRLISEIVRLVAFVLIAMRAGVQLNQTIRDEIERAVSEVDSDDAPEYPEGSIGAAVQQAMRNVAKSMQAQGVRN